MGAGASFSNGARHSSLRIEGQGLVGHMDNQMKGMEMQSTVENEMEKKARKKRANIRYNDFIMGNIKSWSLRRGGHL